MALENQNVDDRELVHVSVTLEFLADLCADGGHRDVKGVHRLDLGGLYDRVITIQLAIYLPRCSPQPP